MNPLAASSLLCGAGQIMSPISSRSEGVKWYSGNFVEGLEARGLLEVGLLAVVLAARFIAWSRLQEGAEDEMRLLQGSNDALESIWMRLRRRYMILPQVVSRVELTSFLPI